MIRVNDRASALSHIKEAGYRVRLWLMWKISPVQKHTIDGVLEKMQEIEDDDTSRFDNAREIRYLFRFVDTAWWMGDETEYRSVDDTDDDED